MKILFVCRANVGRSQMAEVIFNKLSKKHKAISSGVNPEKWEGKTLRETKYVLPSLKEIDINADENVSKKIKKEMVDDSDKIIVIGVDKETWPDYLKNSNKVEYWNVEDPAHGDMEKNRMVRNQIEEKVKELIKRLN